MLRSLSLAAPLSTALRAASPRVFEIRTYTTSRNMDDVKALFRNDSLALFKKHGLDVIGYWVPQDPPRSRTTFIYILAFPDRESAKLRWAAFHSDPAWLRARDAFIARHGPVVDKIESEFLSPTDFSPLH